MEGRHIVGILIADLVAFLAFAVPQTLDRHWLRLGALVLVACSLALPNRFLWGVYAFWSGALGGAAFYLVTTHMPFAGAIAGVLVAASCLLAYKADRFQADLRVLSKLNVWVGVRAHPNALARAKMMLRPSLWL